MASLSPVKAQKIGKLRVKPAILSGVSGVTRLAARKAMNFL